jgi:hypothetical protein
MNRRVARNQQSQQPEETKMVEANTESRIDELTEAVVETENTVKESLTEIQVAYQQISLLTEELETLKNKFVVLEQNYNGFIDRVLEDSKQSTLIEAVETDQEFIQVFSVLLSMKKEAIDSRLLTSQPTDDIIESVIEQTTKILKKIQKAKEKE